MPHGDLHQKKRPKNYVVLAIIFGLCVLIWAVTLIKIDRANASDPCSFSSLSVSVSPGVCDIYTRQLAYRDEAVAFRNAIQARAVGYAAPREAMKRRYKQQLEALHDRVTEDNIPSFFATWRNE